MLMGLGWVGREMQCLVVSHLASEAQTFQSAVGQVQRDSGEAALLGIGAGLGCFGWSLSHTPVKGHQGGRRTHLSIYFAFSGNRHFKRQRGEKHSLVGLVCWLFVAWEARVSAFILAPLILKSWCLSPLPAHCFVWVSIAPVEEKIFHVGIGRNGDPWEQSFNDMKAQWILQRWSVSNSFWEPF